MTRGQQKVQAQQRNQKRQQEAKKQQSVHDHKASAQKALIYQCTICRSQMPDVKTYTQHFENKHPKAQKPPELLGETSV